MDFYWEQLNFINKEESHKDYNLMVEYLSVRSTLISTLKTYAESIIWPSHLILVIGLQEIQEQKLIEFCGGRRFARLHTGMLQIEQQHKA